MHKKRHMANCERMVKYGGEITNTNKNKHGVYIPADLWEQLQDFCEKHYNVSCSAVICRAIKELIEKEGGQII
jgi:hypothetical protein